VNSWNAKHHSPLLPREKKTDKSKNDGKVPMKSNNKPIPSQPCTRTRSRIPRPRPRPQPREIGHDLPLSTDVDNPEHILDGERNSPCLETNDTIGMVPISYAARVESVSERPNYPIPNKAFKIVDQTGTQGAVNQRIAKNLVPPSKASKLTDASGNTQSHNVKVPTAEALRAPVAVTSKAILKEVVDNPTDHTDPSFRLAKPGVSRNQNPERSSQQAVTLDPFPNSENSTRRPPRKTTAKVAGKYKTDSNWYEPLTPTDVTYSSGVCSPRVVSDSWSDYQTEVEREAEEMAERDLAYAGKLFDSLSDSFGGSATSAFPVSSFAATSNMSIVSYNSDLDHSDGDIAVPTTEEAEESKEVETKKSTKRIGTFRVTFYDGILSLRDHC
jgi:hypothetical protein